MLTYILRRIFLIFPTVTGILVINFIIIQAAPGGPIEQMLAKIKGTAIDATTRFGGKDSGETNFSKSPSHMEGDRFSISKYRGARGIDPDLIKDLERQFGFDKPPHVRFLNMLSNYARFELGNSFFKDESVFKLILSRMPVSVSLGIWTTAFIYLISIPLGIKKAISDGSRFDVLSSSIVAFGYAVPGFLFAILLIVLFAGGRYFSFFPLRGLFSDNFHDLSFYGKITDYLWHITLPVLSMVIGGFAGLTMLTKNSFIEEINKQYVTTARSKGLSQWRVLYCHVFRNAMLIVIAGFPTAFIGALFTGALITEVIFSLNGMGLLGFEAAIQRDYPVMFGTLYVFTLMGLLLNLLGDIIYHIIDPRIDFESRGN